MKIKHTPYHWIVVAIALVALLLTFSEAYGQATGAGAVFEGRPAMAGAQGGLGAQAGVPQGGIGVQGNDVAERSLRRKPTDLDEIGQARRDNEPDVIAAADADKTDKALRKGKEVKPARDRSLAKEQRSATRTASRAAKRTISRARHGVSEIDSQAASAR